MNIILTGATGTLGSRILYELFIQKNNVIDRVFVLTRSSKKHASIERVRNVLRSEFAPEYIKKNIDKLLKKVTAIDTEDFLIPESFLPIEDTNHFIHSAGYVNLSTDERKREEIFNENHEFSKEIFLTYSRYINKFTYISTAFAIGDVGGKITNDFLNYKEPRFRNFYEEAKFETEQFIFKKGATLGMPIQILRPSVLGGNILDIPNFFISKYMVFYLFAKFFYKTKSKDQIRVEINQDTGLNVVPTDYAAKVIVKVLEDEIQQLNIAHPVSTNHGKGMTKLFESVGYRNFSLVDKISIEEKNDSSDLEAFYYDKIGVHLSPYLNSIPYEYDTTILESILPIPKYDLERYIVDTITYARKRNFKNERW